MKARIRYLGAVLLLASMLAPAFPPPAAAGGGGGGKRGFSFAFEFRGRRYVLVEHAGRRARASARALAVVLGKIDPAKGKGGDDSVADDLADCLARYMRNLNRLCVLERRLGRRRLGSRRPPACVRTALGALRNSAGRLEERLRSHGEVASVLVRKGGFFRLQEGGARHAGGR